MTGGPTLDVAALAAELGRSETWVYANWRTEARAKRLPWPLHDGAPPIRWSRAQVYAFIDIKLTPPQRLAAAAYRAAAAAAAAETPHTATTAIEDAEWRAKLDARFNSDRSTP